MADPLPKERGVLVDGDLFLKASRHLRLPERAEAVLRQANTRRYLSVVSVWHAAA